MEQLAQGALWVVQTIYPERSGTTQSVAELPIIPRTFHLRQYMFGTMQF